METNKLKEIIDINLSKEEIMRKSYETGKSEGIYEERKRKEKKSENQENLKFKFKSFIKNDLPFTLFCIGIPILIAGLWIDYRLIITGGVISIFGYILDKL